MMVPHSPVFRRHQDRDRRITSALTPVMGAALIGYAIWNP
jgi:hypothetical protein